MQRVTDNRFQARHQEYFRKSPPNPHAFCTLPSSIVDEIGLKTHMGARIDSAILASFVFHAKQFADGESVLAWSTGPVTKPDGQFILSVLTVAEDLWKRWFHINPDSGDFTRFYERVRKAAGRLRAGGFIEWCGWVSEERKRTQGSFWTLRGTKMEPHVARMEQVFATGLTLMQSAIDVFKKGDLVNVVDLVGSAFLAENIGLFTEGEARYSKEARGFWMNQKEWTEFIASKGAAGSRFTSVGAFRPEDVHRDDAPVAIWWVPLDIDRHGDIIEAYDVVQRLLEELEYAGADLDHILVSPTWGKGFHVRIPCGMFGNMVFKSETQAQVTLRQWAKDFLDEYVDESVFAPRQIIRMIGSRREENGLYVRAFTGSAIQEMSFEDVYMACMNFVPFAMPDPRDAPIAPELVLSMVAANDRARQVKMPSSNDGTPELGGEDDAGTVLAAAMKGCEEGEEWHPPRGGRTYIGRSKLLFIVACDLLRQFDGNEDTAWEALQIVNNRCSPPLRLNELRGRLRSAQRTLKLR